MFDFLNELPLTELTTGVHYTLRRLSHPSRTVRGPDVSPGDEAVAEKVLEEISEREGSAWRPGDNAVVEKYILKLCEIVWARTKRELKLDPVRGRRLLEELREVYAEAGLRD